MKNGCWVECLVMEFWLGGAAFGLVYMLEIT